MLQIGIEEEFEDVGKYYEVFDSQETTKSYRMGTKVLRKCGFKRSEAQAAPSVQSAVPGSHNVRKAIAQQPSGRCLSG